MSNYATLKAAIQSAVYTNNNNEITGAGLQSVLLQIVDTVGDGYVFKGVATAGTAPGTPDANVFYIAPAGTYTNFGSSYTVPVGSVGVFSWNGSWSKESLQCLDYATVESPETIIEYNGDTGWQRLLHPLQSGLYSLTWYSDNGQLMLTNINAQTANVIKFNKGGNANNIFYIPDKGAQIDAYACQLSGTRVGLRKIDESDISGNIIRSEAMHVSDIVTGYVNNLGSFVSSSSYDWLYFRIPTTIGHIYLLPYSWLNGSIKPIVGLDSSNNIVKTYSIGGQEYKNGYLIFKAETSKVGITYRAMLGNGVGNNFSISDVMGLPYWDLTECEGDALFYYLKKNNQLVTDLFPLEFTEVASYNEGYYDRYGQLIEPPTAVGTWKYANIDTEAGAYYLINTCINNNVRIYDLDEDGTILHKNKSIPDAFYSEIHSTTGNLTWVLVKAGSDKLGISFNLPSPYYYPKSRHVPVYAKLDRNNIENINNGIVMLFAQLYSIIEESKGVGKTYIVNKSGGGDYTSLVEAVMDNMGKWNVTLHLEEGTYDVIQELTDYYGTADFRIQTPSGRGLELGYNITIEGSPNAVIVANYTGSDEGMQKSFSPLNCYNAPNVGGMTLRGVNIRCSRVRYCVHDEKETTGTGSYNNLYENCNFYIDNTNNNYWHSSQCIGGGLGHSGSVIVRNSIFEEIDPGNPTMAAVSYHNNANAGAKSMITCTGNYIKGARGFRFSWYGQSTEITEVICANNSVGRATEYRAETQDTSPIQNVTLYDFNNIVRS